MEKKNVGDSATKLASLDASDDFVCHDHICISWKTPLSKSMRGSGSPKFYFHGCTLTLNLMQTASYSKNREIYFYSICICSSPPLDGIYDIETYLLNKKGEHLKRNRFVDSLRYVKEIWSMEESELLSKANCFLTKDILHFVCIINDFERYCQENRKKVDSFGSNLLGLDKLSLDFAELYNSGKGSDVALKCGNRMIFAHKSVLSARSEVFEAMFRKKMTECKDEIVNIVDIEFPILDHVLRYIYSGVFGEVSSMDTAVLIYQAADKYSVNLLKSKCAQFIRNGISEANACALLVLADLHSEADLKSSVLSFLENKKRFILSNQFKDFLIRNPLLALEVYEAVIKQLPLT